MNVQFKEDNESSISSKEHRQCEICFKSKASYSCPRCNIGYCGLSCYRDSSKHLECSESFYEEQVMTELKMCKLEDSEDKEKMVEILKKVQKEYEKERILPDCSDEDEKSDEEDSIEADLTDNKLIKAYETELAKWLPWWREFKELKLKEIYQVEKDFKIDPSLAKKSMRINVENANPLILNDILQLFYTYAIIAYVYQLDESPDGSLDENANLNDELVFNFLKIDEILKNKVTKNKDIGNTISLAIKVLLEDLDLFLKDHLNNEFLINLIDEVIFISESPMILPKFLSSIYSILSNYIKSKKQISIISNNNNEIKDVEEPVDESPINVFHYNKENFPKKNNSCTTRKSRIEIIKPQVKEVKKIVNNKPEGSLKPEKLKPDNAMSGVKNMLRRIEFYFRWLNLNEKNIKKSDRIKNTLNGLEMARETLSKDIECFNSEKQLIERNIDELRKQQNNSTNKRILIEEL